MRGLYGWMGVVLGIALAMTTIAQSNAQAAITRSEHCDRLSLQLDEALETQANATQAAQATALQRRASQFCADHKQAQGIRTLANALKLLGVTPDEQGQ